MSGASWEVFRFVRRVGLALLLASSLSCAHWGRQHWLDATYPPGAPRSAGAVHDSVQTNHLLRSFSLPGDDPELPDAAARALGKKRLRRAAGYDVYDVRIWTGNHHLRRLESMCDYVFYGEDEKLVGAYRAKGLCPR